MYKQIKISDGPFMGLEIREEVSDRETRDLVELIDQRFKINGPVRLLVVYEGEPGLISAESLYENMRFAKLAGDKLARMAVVGRHSWENTWVSLFGLFGGIETRYFLSEDFDDALKWLGS